MKYLNLFVVSLLAGILWRLELHVRWGWESLDWIGAFHWAFPAASAFFLLWMKCELKDLSGRTTNLLLCLCFGLSLVAYFGGGITMMWANNRWLGFLAKGQIAVYLSLPVIIYGALGFIYFMSVKKLLTPSLKVLGLSVLVYLIAFPAALFLLWLTQHRGGADIIHTIKSGFVFPIIVFSLGLPILKINRQPQPSAESPASVQTG